MEEMDRFLEKFNYSRLYPQYPNLVKIETNLAKEDKEIVNKHTSVSSRCWWNVCTVNFGRQLGTFLQI